MTDVDDADEPDEHFDDESDWPVARRRWPLVLAALVVLAGLGVGLGVGLSGGSAAAAGPEGVALQNAPDLASADSTATGAPVDGITCRTAKDQVVKYHIHDLVEIFVNGRQERIPAGAGIPAPRLAEHFPSGVFYDNGIGGCLYWLHVHTADGVVHVESPYKHTFTLGQFFDVWRQPLGTDQVGPAHGNVVAFVDGRPFAGDPRDIPLLPHGVIQLDVGTPVVAFQPVTFSVTGLCGSGTQGCAAGG
ncbi:MAG: hypothetical protein ACYDA2_06705 [Acidimicrobiales bacterium]